MAFVINITIEFTPLLQATAKRYTVDFPNALLNESVLALGEVLDETERLLTLYTPEGATGRVKAGIPETKHSEIPSPNEFMMGRAELIGGVGLGRTGYEYYTEYGRGSGRWPPFEPIHAWVTRSAPGKAFLERTIDLYGKRGNRVRRAVYLIRRAHGLRGTAQPAHPLQRTWTEMQSPAEARFAEVGKRTLTALGGKK